MALAAALDLPDAYHRHGQRLLLWRRLHPGLRLRFRDRGRRCGVRSLGGELGHPTRRDRLLERGPDVELPRRHVLRAHRRYLRRQEGEGDRLRQSFVSEGATEGGDRQAREEADGEVAGGAALHQGSVARSALHERAAGVRLSRRQERRAALHRQGRQPQPGHEAVSGRQELSSGLRCVQAPEGEERVSAAVHPSSAFILSWSIALISWSTRAPSGVGTLASCASRSATSMSFAAHLPVLLPQRESDQLAPLPCPSAAVRRGMSAPRRFASVSASKLAAMHAHSSMLLTVLAIWPAPTSPRCSTCAL